MAGKIKHTTDGLCLIQSLGDREDPTGEQIWARLDQEAIVPVWLYKPKNREELVGALRHILQKGILIGEYKNPAIHIDCHGSEEGITLESGEIVPWADLQALFRQIINHVESTLVLVLGACMGADFYSYLTIKERCPCSVFVGSKEILLVEPLVDRFCSFYQTLFRKGRLEDAMEVLNKSWKPNDGKFVFYSDERIFAKVSAQVLNASSEFESIDSALYSDTRQRKLEESRKTFLGR